MLNRNTARVKAVSYRHLELLANRYVSFTCSEDWIDAYDDVQAQWTTAGGLAKHQVEASIGLLLVGVAVGAVMWRVVPE